MSIPTIEQLTPAMLSAIAGAIISLLFRFVPGLSDWYATLNSQTKQLFMLLIVVIVATIIGVYNYFQTGITWSSLLLLLFTLYTAATANQTTYRFIRSTHVKETA